MTSIKLYHTDGRRISDFTIEKAVLGEVKPEILAELNRVPGFQEEVERRRTENERFLKTYTPESMIPNIKARALESSQKEKKASILSFPKISGIAAAAALVIILVAGPLASFINGRDPGSEDRVRLKGLEPSLHIFRPDSTTPLGVRELPDQASVAAYDTLQISYNAAGYRYGAIISIDGRQMVTLHHPETYNAQPELTPSGEVLLPYAYQIDDAPDIERFYLITAAQSFHLNDLLTIIKRQAATQSWLITGELDLGSEYHVKSITLQKEQK